MTTAGGQQLVLTGTALGLSATNHLVRAFWGTATTPELLAASSQELDCEVVTDTSLVHCTTLPGVGKDITVMLDVAGQVVIAPVTVRYELPTVSSIVQGDYPTDGSANVTIQGANFGPSGTTGITIVYQAASGPLYGPTGQCTVTTSHTELTCPMVPGYGGGLAVRVTVGEQQGPRSSVTFRYNRPSLSTVLATLPTIGLTSLTLTGDNFGPIGPQSVDVVYGPTDDEERFRATSCSVTVHHTQITCTTSPGYGGQLSFSVTVGGLPGLNTAGELSYQPPAISSVTVVGNSDLREDGGTQVTIKGQNFGPIDGGIVTGVFSPRLTPAHPSLPSLDSTPVVYGLQQCRVRADHTEIVCVTSAGVGRDLIFTVTVEGITSAAASSSVRFTPPSITQVHQRGAVYYCVDILFCCCCPVLSCVVLYYLLLACSISYLLLGVLYWLDICD